MTFSEKSRYDRIFKYFKNRGGEYEINYIKRFQNTQALSVSAGKSYYGDQFMHSLLDKFHQGGKYTTQIASHQVELIREEKFTDQNSLSISSLQTDYLNLDNSSGSVRNNKIENIVQMKLTFCGGTTLILVSTGPQDPTVHFTQCFCMDVD